MSAEDLERYETEMELQLYREYRDVVAMFSHVVETERRFYLANEVTVTPHHVDGNAWFQVDLRDAWVWDMYRPARFVQQVRVLTCRDVNVEQLPPGTDEPPPFLTSSTGGSPDPDGPPAAGGPGRPGGSPPDGSPPGHSSPGGWPPGGSPDPEDR